VIFSSTLFSHAYVYNEREIFMLIKNIFFSLNQNSLDSENIFTIKWESAMVRRLKFFDIKHWKDLGRSVALNITH
jgi:hypothetical protein